MYGVSNEDYIKSLGPENFLGNLIIIKNRSLRELCSTGKSGSFFYYSYDSKFVLKTIPLKEFEFYKSILMDYYNHMDTNPDTFIQRFYGLHTMMFNDQQMHFVIMNNVFNTNLQVQYKYDLKGSTFQRISRKKDAKNYDGYDYSIPLKDLDWIDRKESILLTRTDKDKIMKELLNDAEFLSSKNINDYSLLIGVHNQGKRYWLYDLDMNNGIGEDSKTTLMENLNVGVNRPPGDYDSENVARLPFSETNKGGILSNDYKKIYFIGIIDIFTEYGYRNI